MLDKNVNVFIYYILFDMDLTIPLDEPFAFDINSWLYNVKSDLNNIVYFIKDKYTTKQYPIIWQNSSITATEFM